jgi:hypothetical protein
MDRIWPLHTFIRLKAEDVEDFRRGLHDFLKQYKGKSGEGESKEGNSNASLTLLFYPFTPPDGEPDPKP